MDSHKNFLAQYGTPSHHEKMMGGDDESKIAMAKYGDESFKPRLFKDPDDRVVRVAHDNATLATHDTMLDDKNLPTHQISRIVDNRGNSLVHKIMDHPNTDEHVMKKLYDNRSYGNRDLIINRLLNRPNTDRHTLSSIVADNAIDDHQVHRVLTHPNIHDETLSCLSDISHGELNDEILNHKSIGKRTALSIAFNGTEDHAKQLIKKPEVLEDMSSAHIAKKHVSLHNHIMNMPDIKTRTMTLDRVVGNPNSSPEHKELANKILSKKL